MMEVLNGKVRLHAGDCLDVLASLKPNSIDACVTDPPYHLTPGRATGEIGHPSWNGKTQADRSSRKAGFMGKAWDGGDIAFRPEMWREVYRVLKPGGHILAFGGTRTYHRMACAIEDAGFEIRDCVQWIYSQGFPKSHDVSKGIDKAAGAKREIVGINEDYLRRKPNGMKTAGANIYGYSQTQYETDARITASATSAARQWEGWGTALKPANEPICLARKPLSESTVAGNVLRWNTGALNINGCRVGVQNTTGSQPVGRWPANLLHDGSEEVVGAFPSPHGAGHARDGSSNPRPANYDGVVDIAPDRHTGLMHRFGDSGSAARFFYCAKASKKDRAGSKHPTVKPIKLIRYLIRLITPPKGVVLDPFAGSGTTGEAAVLEGARAVLIEREREYIRDIRRRIGKPVAQRLRMAA